MARLHRALWVGGLPLRAVLIGLIRLYRLALSPFLGGSCRFHPSCSSYAEQAIRNAGAIRGSFLTAWRVLRCSPLSHGGVDQPPGKTDRVFLCEFVGWDRRNQPGYDAIVQTPADRIPA